MFLVVVEVYKLYIYMGLNIGFNIGLTIILGAVNGYS